MCRRGRRDHDQFLEIVPVLGFLELDMLRLAVEQQGLLEVVFSSNDHVTMWTCRRWLERIESARGLPGTSVSVGKNNNKVSNLILSNLIRATRRYRQHSRVRRKAGSCRAAYFA